MDNQAFWDKIDDFLLSRLPDAEAEAMRQAIDLDAELNQAVQLRRLEFEVAEQVIGGEIRARLDKFRAEEEPSSRKFSDKWFLWPMVLAALLAIAWFIFKPDPSSEIKTINPPPEQLIRDTAEQGKGQVQAPPTPQQAPATTPAPYRSIANAYYKQTNATIVDGLRSVGADSTYDAALNAWKSSRWKKVLGFTRKISSSNPQYEKARMLEGNTLLKLGRYSQARQLFSELLIDENGPYFESAQWLVLLAQLATQRQISPEFQVKLAEITADSNHVFFREAVQLKVALEVQ